MQQMQEFNFRHVKMWKICTIALIKYDYLQFFCEGINLKIHLTEKKNNSTSVYRVLAKKMNSTFGLHKLESWLHHTQAILHCTASFLLFNFIIYK